MGNGPSRRQRNELSLYRPPPPTPAYSPPPGPVSFTSLPPYHPTRFPPPYYSHFNGSFMPPTGHFHPALNFSGGHPLSSSTTGTHLPQSSSAPVDSLQQTVTIRNAVNVQKNTLRLVKDAKNPGFYLLAFSYDADSAGSFSIFLFAKEDDKDGSIKPWNPKAFTPVRIPFEKGFGQKFLQPSGTGFYLDAFDAALLEKEWPIEGSPFMPVEGCPLVIRAQIHVKDYPHDSDEDLGAALPKSVNSQITQAVIEKKDDGECKVRVLRQIIWVDGVRYELKELYGVENTVDQKSDYSEEDFGKECVICMSEPRDTAVMPCRHMCMCNVCASTFKSQMNRCPICRQPVESLLKIKG